MFIQKLLNWFRNKKASIKKISNKISSAFLIFLIIASFIFSVLLYRLLPGSEWKDRINDILFQWRYYIKGKEKISPYIINLCIDDKSIRELDLSVRNRSVYSRLINLLDKAGASSIAVDVLFTDALDDETDKELVEAVQQSLAYLPVVPKTADTGSASGPGSDEDPGSSRILEKKLWHPVILNDGDPPVADVVMLSFPALSEAAGGLGHVTLLPDDDGMNRKFPLLFQYGEGYLPALSLLMVCKFYKVEPGNIEITFGKHIRLKEAEIYDGLFRDIIIPIDRKGRIILNYTGPWDDSFYHFPVYKLLTQSNQEEYISGLESTVEKSLVMISDISTRGKDFEIGLFNKIFPQSGIQLTIINSILTNNFLKEPALWEEALVNICMLVLLCFFAVRFKPVKFSLLTLTAGCVYLGINAFLLIYFNRLVVLLPVLMTCLLSLILVNIYRYITAERKKDMFKAYNRQLEAGKKAIELRNSILLKENRELEDYKQELERKRALLETENKELETDRQELAARKEHLEQANSRFAEDIKILEFQKESLEKLDRLKTDFFQNITHELKNPITLIRAAFIQNIEAGNIKDTTHPYVKTMKNNCDKVMKLVDDFLTFSKIDAGWKGIEKQITDMDVLIKCYVSELESIAKMKELNLCYMKKTKAKITGAIDRNLFESAFFNLISNAFRFTGRGGRIEVQLCPDDTRGQYLVSVSDTGRGIEQEKLGKIFDRFVSDGGTGIGLTLVKEIINLHGGEILVESTPGKGSTFTFKLPLCPPVQEQKEPMAAKKSLPDPIPGDRTNQQKKKIAIEKKFLLPLIEEEEGEEAAGGDPGVDPFIFIVEDNRDMIGLYRSELQEGFYIEHASNGREGILKLAAMKRNPDLIISDIIMPEMDGREFFFNLIRDDRYKDIPMLFVSGSCPDENLDLLKAGAIDFIAKPFTTAFLRTKIRGILKREINIRKDLTAPLRVVLGDAIDNYIKRIGATDTEARYILPGHVRDKYGLTDIESALIPLIARGKKDRDIADELNLAVKTINFHCGSIYKKTGVNGRIELISKLYIE